MDNFLNYNIIKGIYNLSMINMDNKENVFKKLLSLSYDELLMFFYMNKNYLKDYRVILFSSNGNHIPLQFKDIICNEVSMISLSPENNFYILDYNNIDDTMLNNGKSDIYFSGCVHLDTQIISYLNQIYTEGIKSTEVYNTYIFLSDLIERNLDFTNDLYFIENCTKADDDKTFSKIQECLLSYSHYKDTTKSEFEQEFNKNINYTNEDYIFLKEAINTLNRTKKDKLFFVEQKDLTFCLLLKLACIQFSSKRTADNKFKLLNDFINNKLGIYLERETAICYLYLNNNENTKKFFKKFQRNAKDLLGIIEGMAWDLTHIRTTEFFMARDQIDKDYFTNHYIATYDRGLRDVLKVYPLDRIVFCNGEYRESFKTLLVDFISDKEFKKNFIELQETRHSIFKSLNIEKLKIDLINELESITNRKLS